MNRLPPGLVGFLMAQDRARQQEAGNLQQVATVQGLLARMQEQDAARAAAAKDAEYRTEVAAATTPEQRISVASKYLGPKDLATLQQGAMDREATRELTRETKASQLEMQRQFAEARHEVLLQRASSEEARAAETVRHNKAMEAIQKELAELRANPPTPKPPAPKVGYRYKADGSGEQEPIPGGPVAVKLNEQKSASNKSVALTVQNIDRLDTAMGELERDPGLDRITGSVMGRTPNLTNAATGAQAKLDSIKSQVFVQALQAMREASKTGGAVGAVTEKEGDKLENTLAALNQAQGTADFKVQLQKARAQLSASRAAIRRAYAEQFGEEHSSAGVPEAPAVAPVPGGAWTTDKERRYQELLRKRGGS